MIDNGGMIGNSNFPTPDKTRGMWSLKEQLKNNKEKYWPKSYIPKTWSDKFGITLGDGALILPSTGTAPSGVHFREDGLKVYTTDTGNFRIYEHNLSTAWDISTATSVGFYTTTTYEAAAPTSVFLTSDGTGMFVLGDSNDAVYYYKLTTAWTVSTAVPVGKRTYSASGTSITLPDGVTFKPDGTKMYACDGQSTIRRIIEYNVTTPWDITTATTATTIIVSINPKSVRFNNDGKKMYIQADNGIIYEYILPTAWVVTGAVLASDYITTTTYETSPQGITFSPDGLKMYVIGTTSDSIFQYPLSTAWDIYSIGTPVSRSVATQATAPNGLTFGNNGFNLYIVDDTANAVFAYSLSVAYDISSTFTYLNTFAVGTQTTSPGGIAFSDDGTKMFVTSQTASTVWGYTLSTPWNITTATTPVSRSVGNIPSDIYFNSTGTKMWVCVPGTSVNIYEYTVSPAWTGTLTQVATYSTGRTEYGIVFSTDGTKMYCVDTSTDVINMYYLPTAFSISGANIRGRFTSSTYLASCVGLSFSDDGTKMFFANSSSIAEATLSEAWNLGTAIYNTTVVLPLIYGGITECFLSNGGKAMYIVGTTNDKIYQFTLTTANTFTGGYSYSGQLDILSASGQITGLYVKPDGTEFYILSSAADSAFYSGKFHTPWDINTAGLYFSLALAATFATDTCSAMSFSSDGTKLYIIGYNIIYRYNLSVPWVLTSATYSGLSYNAATSIVETFLTGIAFDTSGTYMFVTGGSNSKIHKFTLATPWSFVGITYNGFYDVYETSLKDLYIRSNNLEIYTPSVGTNRLNKLKLVSENDITNPITYNSKFFTTSTQATSMTDFMLDMDNKVLFSVSSTDFIYQYELTNPSDISTAVYTNKSFLTTNQGGTNLYSIYMDQTSKTLYTNNNNRIYQYKMQRRNDLTDMIYSNKQSTGALSSENFYISSDGTKLFWASNAINDYIYEYNLSTPWDISTQVSASVNTFLITTYESNVRSVSFNNTGTQMYVIGNAGYISIFNLKTPWTLTGAYYAGRNFIGSIVSSPYGLRISDDGTKLYVSNTSTIYQFDIRSS